MIPPNLNPEAPRLPSPDGPGGTGDPEATTSFHQPDRPRPVATGPGVDPADAKRFAFLGPPRAEGDLGSLAHYRVRSLIGEGNIGLVFLAEDTQLCRPVALKVIKPEMAGAPGVRERFIREAQAAAAIKHDHIVTIHQVGRDVDVQFLAMEYLQGLSLQSWLERGRKASTDLVLRVGREIAAGLAAAHRHGLIHRDIKPANIWLEAPSGRVKILDFGMARSERHDAQLTHAGTVMGTPAYMAPEQASGETAGAGSDLFSLGCVLYRLCTGRSPFEGATILAVLSALASATPRSLREIEPEVRPALDELVMRLLAKDPTARPASARAVVDAIRAIERELLAERQKAEFSDDPNRPVAADVLGLNEAGITTGREERRAGSRAGRVGSRMAVVLTAVGLIAMLGALVINRAQQDSHVTTPPAAHADATPDLLDSGAIVSPRANPAPASRGAGDDGHPLEAVRPTLPGRDSEAPSGQPTSVDSSRQPVPDRANKPEMPSLGGKTGEDQPPSMVDGSSMASVATGTTPSRDDWGPPIDPDGDCKFDLVRSSNEINIAVPGTPHLLSAEIGRWNAPRLLRPVRGDFDASVSVTGLSRPAGRATSKEYAPYHGAGLLLWQDDRNYVRLEIAADVHKGKTRPYANFELRRGGVLTVSKGSDIKDGSTRLRLEKRGSEVRAAFGPDGFRWTWFAPLTVDFGDSLEVGVAAINSATKPLNAKLEMFAITKPSRAGGDRGEGGDKPGRPEGRPSP